MRAMRKSSSSRKNESKMRILPETTTITEREKKNGSQKERKNDRKNHLRLSWDPLILLASWISGLAGHSWLNESSPESRLIFPSWRQTPFSFPRANTCSSPMAVPGHPTADHRDVTQLGNQVSVPIANRFLPSSPSSSSSPSSYHRYQGFKVPRVISGTAHHFPSSTL